MNILMSYFSKHIKSHKRLYFPTKMYNLTNFAIKKQKTMKMISRRIWEQMIYNRNALLNCFIVEIKLTCLVSENI